MEERWRGPGVGTWIAGGLPALLLVGTLVAEALAAGATGPNVHRPDADCRACHTADRDALEADRGAAGGLPAADLDPRRIVCHGNEGPSHHTGIRPVKPVPETLPLSAEGLITCTTCHFVHGEPAPFMDFVRIENSRGGLCLTCHELAELQ